MEYRGNPKHKEPWQPGRRGSLCPKELTLEAVESLLRNSVQVGNKRYATWRQRAFAAQEHDEVWHGYPIGWKEVPQPVRHQWRQAGLVSNGDIKKFWEGER